MRYLQFYGFKKTLVAKESENLIVDRMVILIRDKKVNDQPEGFSVWNVKNDVVHGIKSKCRIISEL